MKLANSLVGPLLFLILGDLVAAAAPSFSCLGQNDGTPARIISDPPANAWVKAGEGLFGANVMYHSEDDLFWERLPRSTLKSIGISSLRYPGGEVGDNYDWQRHALERPKGWPGEAESNEALQQRTDFREFLRHASEVGAREIFFIVNVDGAFRAPGNWRSNLDDYARKAADWVRAVKESGYRVRYWEIGNEPFGVGNFPQSAADYAQVVNRFAAAMRAEDPTILIGAAGPEDIEKASIADRFENKALIQYKEGRIDKDLLCKGHAWSPCLNKVDRGNRLASPEAWWPTVLKLAGRNIDFAVVHRYRRAEIAPNRRPSLTNKLKRLRAFLARSEGRDIPLALTEWNVPNEERQGRLSELDHFLEMGIQLGSNAASGVKHAHYWTLRTPTGFFKPLLTEDGKPTALGLLFKTMSVMLHDADVAEHAFSNELYVLAIRREELRGYMIVNRTPENLGLVLPESSRVGSVVVQRFSSEDGLHVSPVAECMTAVDGMQPLRVGMPAGSIGFFTLNRD